jgi:DNA repair exonuclease SbcCD nuclease subunit
LDYLFSDLPYDQRGVRRREVFAGLRRVAELARECRVDALLIVGDLFDPEHLSRETLAQTVALFRSLTTDGIPALIVPGNHDALDSPGSPYAEGVFPPGVHIFRGQDFTACRVVEGLTVWGMPFTTAARRQRSLRGFAERFPPDPGEGFRVVAHHGAFTGFALPEGDYAPVAPQDLLDTRAHYVALGHHHNPRDCSSPDGVPAWYPGTPARLDWTNLPDRQALLVRFRPGARVAEVQPLPLDDRPLFLVEFNPGQRPLEELFSDLEALADPRALVRVVLEGPVDGASLVNARRLEEDLRGRFFHLRVLDRTHVAEARRPGSTIAALFLARLQRHLEDPAGETADRDAIDLARKYGLAALQGEDLR